MALYNPNDTASESGGLFGLPYTIEESEIVVLPFEWDVSTSNHAGTSSALPYIVAATKQMDLCHPFITDFWKTPIALADSDPQILQNNQKLRPLAEAHIQALEKGLSSPHLEQINSASTAIFKQMQEHCLQVLNNNQKALLVGGEHSCSYALLKALNEKENQSFGILQLDAHLDLRNCYQGFSHSHASVMHKALQLEKISHLCSVGIRDFCPDEFSLSQESPKITTFFQKDLDDALFRGSTWDSLCEHIINSLPDRIYLTLDVDVFDAALVPNTGTPVFGGWQFSHFQHLIKKLMDSDKEIIAVDIVETGPHLLDAMLSAQCLFLLSAIIK